MSGFIGKALLFKLQLLLLAVIVAEAYGATYVQIGDSAGLPYPAVEQDAGDNGVLLKEAYLQISTQSWWERQVSGFEPSHVVEMKMNAKYILQNDNDEEVDLSIKLPLILAGGEESSLSIAHNSHPINYSGVEYANPEQEGTGFLLYTLDLAIPPGRSVMEVNSTSTGVAGTEVDLTLMVRDASRWQRPVEKLVVSSAHENGMITGYSIHPSETTLKDARWEFDGVPDQDLTLRWKTTRSPLASGLDQPPAAVSTSAPSVTPIIAIVAGGAIVGYIAYIRLKRRSRRKEEETQAG